MEKFAIVRKGYDPDAVDDYIRKLEIKLAEQEEVVKNCEDDVAHLSDAIESYKIKEAAINNAIINAQISADNILLNAKNAAENIVNNARNQAQIIEEETDKRLMEVLSFFEPKRKLVQDLRREQEALLYKYQRAFGEGDYQIINDKIDTLEDHIRRLLSDYPEQK